MAAEVPDDRPRSRCLGRRDGLRCRDPRPPRPRHTVIGFGNPLRDLAGDAAHLAEFLRTINGPIVLVGHSYGGNVISAAAIDNDQVMALVYFQRLDVR
jgi:pimeloyl-ACP methyl ester carboxylesterase